MKRLAVLAAALCALIAFAAVTASVSAKPKPPKTTHVETTIKHLSFSQTGGLPTGDPYNPYTPIVSTFKGQLKASHNCKKNRTVKVVGIGKDITNGSGKFEIVVDGAVAPGTYTVKAKEKTIVKDKAHGRDIIVICEKATDTIDVP